MIIHRYGLNYHNIPRMHLVRIELFDGKIIEGEIIGRNNFGYQLKVYKSYGRNEYLLVNADAIKCLTDLGYI